tara:strand:+ start:466 stop:738 length:273 start_codon:yes stop_codon:yes gene_type:complete
MCKVVKIKKIKVMSDLKNRLIVLSKWLKDSDSGIYIDHDGTLEKAIKNAKQEVKQEIGDYLDEILEMDNHSIDVELENINRRNSNPLMPF